MVIFFALTLAPGALMYNCLFSAMRSLNDTGPNGFEGLVKSLLDSFAPHLGIAFLAKSGWQRGVDVSSAGVGSTWAGLECKHYDAGTCPSATTLGGQLGKALTASREELDVWLLATTGAIDEITVSELTAVANRSNAEVVVIDWQTGLPTLGVLCAADPDLTLRELADRVPTLNKVAVMADLQALAAHGGFQAARVRLGDQLAAANLGFSNARSVANSWIETKLASESDARARLNQPLCPRDTAYATLVKREDVGKALDAWYGGWRVHPSCALIHGREGAGKSWAVLDWWSRLNERPLTMLIASNMPLIPGSDPLDVLSEALDRQIGKREAGFWRRRLERWLRRPASKAPMILMIFDGLNERFRENWGARLVSFRSNELGCHMALLATVWTSFWQERIKGTLPFSNVFPVTPVPVPLYSDAELKQALAGTCIDIRMLNERTRKILRVPRICHHAIRRFPNLIASGDLTVERMLVTDWSHRLTVKHGLVHNDREINRLIMELAGKLRDGMTAFEKYRLRECSSLVRNDPSRDLTRDFEEIIAGDLFERDDEDSDTWRIQNEHVGLALGMLLADEVRLSERQGDGAGDQAVATALEWAVEFSQASAIMRGAVAAASVRSDYPSGALRILLRNWLRLRNRPDEHHNDFQAYLPDQPEIWFDVAEDVWSAHEEYPASREWLRAAILHHLDREDVFGVASRRAGCWLALWKGDRHPLLRGHNDEEHHQRIAARLNSATASERRLIADLLHETDDGERICLADFAFLILSHKPDVVTMADIAAWALSRTIMGDAWERDKMAWLMRLARHRNEDLERSVFEWVDRLLTDAGDLGRGAAWELLFCSGTAATFRRLDEVGGIRHGERWDRDFWSKALDADSPVPDMTESLEVLATLDPASVYASFNYTDADQRFEDMEKGLAAYAPREGAAFVRRMLCSAASRDFMPLRQLSWKAPEHGILVEESEIYALEKARHTLRALQSNHKKQELSVIEANILFAALASIPKEERPEKLSDFGGIDLLPTELECMFENVNTSICNRILIDSDEKNDISFKITALWFLARQTFSLDGGSRAALIRCFHHDDRLVRLLAFRVAVATNDDAVLAYHRAGDWRFSEEVDRVEDFYGTLALGSGSGPFRYDKLRGRAVPELLGWIAERDGSDAAYQSFAEDLDAIWQTLVEDVDLKGSLVIKAEREADGLPPPNYLSTPDVHSVARAVSALTPSKAQDWAASLRQAMDPANFERRQEEAESQLRQLLRQARQAGMRTFGHVMRPYGLEQAFTRRPDLVDKWMNALEAATDDGILFRAGEFYRQLAMHLTATDPPRGASLLHHLRSVSGCVNVVFQPLGINAVTYAAFDVPDSVEIRGLRDKMLEAAMTDEDLFVLALVAQDTGNAGWLADVIDRDAASGVLFLEARALTLIGWLDEGPELERLRPLLENRAGLLADVMEVAISRIIRNHRARYWFEEFLSRRDPELAWGALRLFLRCVDRRHHLWRKSFLEAVPDLPQRWHDSLAQNRQAITHAIKKNEKELQELKGQLFGVKIPRDGLYPWV